MSLNNASTGGAAIIADKNSALQGEQACRERQPMTTRFLYPLLDYSAGKGVADFVPKLPRPVLPGMM